MTWAPYQPACEDCHWQGAADADLDHARRGAESHQMETGHNTQIQEGQDGGGYRVIESSSGNVD